MKETMKETTRREVKIILEYPDGLPQGCRNHKNFYYIEVNEIHIFTNNNDGPSIIN